MLSQLHLQLQADSLLLCAAGHDRQWALHAVHAVGLHVSAGQAGVAPGLHQHHEGLLLPASAWQADIPSPPAGRRRQKHVKLSAEKQKKSA